MKAVVRFDQQTQFLRAAGNVLGGAAEKLLLESRAPHVALHGAYAASLLGPWRRFRRSLARPEQANQLRLKSILHRNTETEFGRTHDFRRIDSIHEYQTHVPIRTYEELEPFIRRAIEGRSGVLTASDVIAFEQTSGSSNFTKLIPYTQTFLNEFETATSAWLADLFYRRPELIGKRTYYAVSPQIHREHQFTSGGIPIGLKSEIDYFGPLARVALGQLSIRPGLTTYRASDVEDSEKLEAVLEEWRLSTAAALLSADDLGLISVWSPTFLFPVFDVIKSHWTEVAARIKNRARRTTLQRLFENFRPDRHAQGMQAFLAEAWPSLKVVSCWADGASADAAVRLGHEIPDHVELDAKGLIATEGVVTIPFSGAPDPVVAVGSHFYEFIDLEHPSKRPRLPHELKVGGLYSPVITTSGGLYRYHLRDMMYCTGRNRGTPTLRFRGRLDRTSDLCGEKLNAAQVERAFEIACSLSGFRPDFFLLSPKRGRQSAYNAFIEAGRPAFELQRFVANVEQALRKNPSYNQALELKELGPIEMIQIVNGIETWERFKLSRGQRLGAIKLVRLDTEYDWTEIFKLVGKKEYSKSQIENLDEEAAVPVKP
ncbi:MAG: GH3 auxin-responsive promoter family protein [Bdellovibrionaceae bacterium]|nr:GH3 auxin-responsive promoter family protein [Pseudobdellovibrionaceae bacterium]